MCTVPLVVYCMGGIYHGGGKGAECGGGQKLERGEGERVRWRRDEGGRGGGEGERKDQEEGELSCRHLEVLPGVSNLSS